MTARRRIVIAEDSRTQAESLRSLLDDAGFDVVVARTGAEAVEALRAAPSDLVVSDVIMPGMSGFDLCAAMRADAALRDIPCILLTSASRDPLRCHARTSSRVRTTTSRSRHDAPAQLLQRIRADASKSHGARGVRSS